jgi:hypothetical protein
VALHRVLPKYGRALDRNCLRKQPHASFRGAIARQTTGTQPMVFMVIEKSCSGDQDGE